MPICWLATNIYKEATFDIIPWNITVLIRNRYPFRDNDIPVRTCFYVLFTKFPLQEWRSLWIQPISHVYKLRLRLNRRNIQNTLPQNLSLTLFTNRVILHLNYLLFLYIKGKNRIIYISIEFDMSFHNCIAKTKQYDIWGK